jgi:hypothetical protein
VPYTLTLYSADQSLIQQVSGTIDLPPATTVPVFVPGVASGKQVVAEAFLTIDPSAIKWFSYAETRALPTYDGVWTITNASSAPRITAMLSDASALPISNVRAVVAVKDVAGNVIAASATLLQSIPGQGSAPVTFTWNQPFVGTAASIEILPIIALP